MTFIGDKNDPLWIGKLKDKAKLLTPEHYGLFDVWQKFNAGFGLPGGRPWDEYDPDLIDYLMYIQNYWKAKKSVDAAKIKLAETTIEAIVGTRGRGRK